MAVTAELAGPIDALLQRGTVIPAHPLALTPEGALDGDRQRALSRHYLDVGVGGLAVGVHTTQFAIRDPDVGLFEPVLRMAAEEMARADRTVVRIAGVCGPLAAAREEIETAAGLGYDLALLSMSAWPDEDQLLADVRTLSGILPIMGFALQPAVGGRYHSYDFWRRFVEIPGVRAIKIATFDRYRSLDILRAIAESQRDDLVAYTGNDDSIVHDLLATPVFATAHGEREVRYVGGLLGQWAVWPEVAVRLHATATSVRGGQRIPPALMRLGAALTDANGAIFDAANGFRGCVPGINEVLRRGGHLATARCLNPDEIMSADQTAQIDRVIAAYPFLWDVEAYDDLMASEGAIPVPAP